METNDRRLKRFRSPKTVISRFVVKRTLKSATVWAFILGAYTASKVIGYVKAYPSVADQAKFARSFGSNTGMSALLGAPHDLTTIAGYANWVTMGVISLIGAVWALLLATKYFRGEEESGRSELLLTGQTTQRQAASSTLIGLTINLVLLYVIVAVMFIAIGNYKGVGIDEQSSLFFALAATSAAAFFLAVGAFTSQLMPTRSQATGIALAVFGVSFILRAIADTTSAHWLLNFTPLGWIEKSLPLVGSQAIWLLPIFGSVLLLYGFTIWIAGRRDLGASVFADHNTSVPHTKLLNTPIQTIFRLTRMTTIVWVVGITLMAYLYGSLTESIIKTLNGENKGIHKALAKLEASHNISIATLFLGVIFLILMVAAMSFVSNSIGKVRKEEADGYVDNFLVQPVSRLRWLGNHLLLITVSAMILCIFASLGVWAGQASQHVGVPFHSLLEAGVNMFAPVLLTLSFGVLAFGLVPRYTQFVAYSVLGWSFLITLIASGTSINHWILDTSILHQVTLAPAVSPDWSVDLWMIGLAIALSAVGITKFCQRDLESD